MKKFICIDQAKSSSLVPTWARRSLLRRKDAG